jgi:hypothetical protein
MNCFDNTRKAALAIRFYEGSSDLHPQHDFCHIVLQSCSGFRRFAVEDKAAGCKYSRPIRKAIIKTTYF